MAAFVIYGNEQQLCGEVLTAFAAGCAARGHEYRFREPSDHTEADGDVAVVWGMRTPSPEIVTAYQDMAKPVMVLELGHIKREDGYYSLGLGRLGWLPPFECPADRARMMGLTPKARNRRKDYVLVCGQKPRDAQHGMGLHALTAWYESAFNTIRAARPTKSIPKGLPIRFRPHPKGMQVAPKGADQVSDPEQVSLAEDLAGAHSMVTINSGSGNLALLMGVPVVASKRAVYSGMVKGMFDYALPLPKRNGFFHRLACTQWTVEEFAKGVPLQFFNYNVKEF